MSLQNLLTDPEKRGAYEAKKKRQEESLERLRKKYVLPPLPLPCPPLVVS